MNEVNYGKCRNLSVIWEFRKTNVSCFIHINISHPCVYLTFYAYTMLTESQCSKNIRCASAKAYMHSLLSASYSCFNVFIPNL